ncbi:MAG TPA: alpha/beta hydrolase [Burkholderiaceae bacterium]|nr:alpha/beta hydrolase [Burkholderiaceae bacterium]
MQHSVQLAEHSAALADSQIHWVEAGQGDILILIHGSLCDYRYWRWQMPAFANHFRVIAPSLPGCWPSPVGAEAPNEADAEEKKRLVLADKRYGMEQHVQAIVALSERIAHGRTVHLLGHSRGAQVALEAALALNGQAGRLVLADPGFTFRGEPPAMPVHVPIAEKLGHAPLDEVIQEFVDTVNGPDTWRRTVPWFKEMVRANAWTLLPQLKDLQRSIDPASLDALSRPLLLVGGEQSPARYGNRIARLMELIPGAQHLVVPRAAHGMNLANARHFNEQVLSFLLGEAL